ncbi:hypothetical protein AB0F25_16840 [Streptomyces wedmorensis]|uniref:hypothetical protein n=1 Tax=Streptomyces wedmorensis TaxID=43759 RepID=UPI00341484BC
MPDTAEAAAALLAGAAAQGAGNTLRIVLLVSLVGGALLAWFLLRGYGGDDADAADAAGGPASRTGGDTDHDANA